MLGTEFGRTTRNFFMANGRRWQQFLAVALVALCAVLLPGVARAADPTPPPMPPTSAAPDAPAPAGEDAAAEAQLLGLLNSDRAANGLAPVSPVDTITAEAVQHSTDMSAQQTLFHDDAYFSKENHTKLGAKKLGQNVALNRTVTDAEARLMADPGHHDIIVDPAWIVVGIGVVRDDTGHIWVTQDFAQTTAAANPPVTPPAGPTPAPVAPPATTPSPAQAPAHAPAPAPARTPASTPRHDRRTCRDGRSES